MAKTIRPIISSTYKKMLKMYGVIGGVYKNIPKGYIVVDGVYKLVWGGDEEVDNRIYLYNEGDSSNLVDDWILDTSRNTLTGATVRENSDQFYFYAPKDNISSQSCHLSIATKNSIDWSKYSKIGIQYDYTGEDCSDYSIYRGYPLLFGFSNKNTSISGGVANIATPEKSVVDGISYLDLSSSKPSVSSHPYFFIYLLNTTDETIWKIKKIWLEL